MLLWEHPMRLCMQPNKVDKDRDWRAGTAIRTLHVVGQMRFAMQNHRVHLKRNTYSYKQTQRFV